MGATSNPRPGIRAEGAPDSSIRWAPAPILELITLRSNRRPPLFSWTAVPAYATRGAVRVRRRRDEQSGRRAGVPLGEHGRGEVDGLREHNVRRDGGGPAYTARPLLGRLNLGRERRHVLRSGEKRPDAVEVARARRELDVP